MRMNPVLVLPAAVVKEGVVASVMVTAPLNWLAPEEVKKVPVEPLKSMLPEAEVKPLMMGAVRVLVESV